jgi:hypothetical protein
VSKANIPRAPISLGELKHIYATALFNDDDVRFLRMSQSILEPQVEKVLDTWYGFVASQPHLAAYFSTSGGDLLPDYLAAVRVRFEQWVRDTAAANYDQEWLDYQLEIGRRHHRVGKNLTDGAKSVAAVDHIHFRYLFPLVVPIVHTLRPFLAKSGATAADLDAMQHAWLKSVLIQVTLWSYWYVKEGEF